MIYSGNRLVRAPGGLGDDMPPPAPAPTATPGLFASGLDVSQWGWMEWAIAAAVAYFAWRLVGDVKRGVRTVRGAGTKRKRKAAKRQELQQQLAKL